MEKIKNEFKLRIYDAQTAQSVDELVKSGRFGSANELLNAALQIGVEKIYIEAGKRKLLTTEKTVVDGMPDGRVLDKILRKTQANGVLLEDMFVMLSSIEALTASLYNALIYKTRGESVSEELLNSGYLAELPDSYREIRDRLVDSYEKKLRKGDKE